MKKEDFDGLMRGLDEARAYARGRPVEGLREHVRQEVDVAEIRKRTGLSQAEFSRQIGVSAGTLRNWEQRRRKPEGPARVLLAMISRDPKIVERTLTEAA